MKIFSVVTLAASVLLAAAPTPATAGTLKAIYVFKGGLHDGGQPVSGLLADGRGNYYGTTYGGGHTSCPNGHYCGTVYKVGSGGKETPLYMFKGGSDGANPISSVLLDSAGNLYGTTSVGGIASCNAPSGCGTVYKIASDGTEKQLHVFTGGTDGAVPYAPLIADSKGNLYGTAPYGGTHNAVCQYGCGAIFEITAKGKFQVLYSFAGGTDGATSFSALLLDSKGNLYGTAATGGTVTSTCSVGCGTVFRLSPKGVLSTLYSFRGGSDGLTPTAPLIADSKGNFYSVTEHGGDFDNCSAGCGTVFRLTTKGKLTTLYAFRGQDDGSTPEDGLTLDASGDLFGTTTAAGTSQSCGAGGVGCGTVFAIRPDGTETTLHIFQDGKDGAISYSVLIPDEAGNLLGTAEFDGGSNTACAYGCGLVYRLSPDLQQPRAWKR